mmetsp:Transcript_64525/g.185506  ORF Transcript_64525/g.185506 Transcript_64525/m.185506 type:complete len:271 (-) Transcript_64525:968-1780(-)
MARPLEQSQPHPARSLDLLVADLQVDVPLPHKLGHVQPLLLHGEVAQGPGAVDLADRVLEVDVDVPRLRVERVCLEKLLIDLPTPVDVAEAHLQVGVVQEDPLLSALRDGPAEDFPGPVEVQLTDLELSVQLPDLGEGELLVRHHLQERVEDLPRLLDVAGLQLLEQGVVDPQVDVPPPEALLRHGGLVGDGALVDLADPADVAATLLEADVVEPHVVVPRVVFDALLVDVSPLVQHDLLDRVAIAMLLLERHVGAVELVARPFRQHIER